MGFDLSNTFEAKVKRQTVLKLNQNVAQQLNLSTSYNLDADGVTSPLVTGQS
jgi:hypothetical protein